MVARDEQTRKALIKVEAENAVLRDLQGKTEAKVELLTGQVEFLLVSKSPKPDHIAS